MNVAAGFQAENGAAIVEQIELHVAPAPDELFLAVGIRPVVVEVAPHEVLVDDQEGPADILGEAEVRRPAAALAFDAFPNHVYVDGPPVWAQKALFTALAPIARMKGYYLPFEAEGSLCMARTQSILGSA